MSRLSSDAACRVSTLENVKTPVTVVRSHLNEKGRFTMSKTQRRYGLRIFIWCLGALVVIFFLSTFQAVAKTDYRKWLDEEAVWIISKTEREQFNKLKDDASREAFIEEFWRRRDPTPNTTRNEYQEEHYRRLAHAMQSFQEGIPGWKTDRWR